MTDNLSLAKRVRDICLENQAQWTIRINGSVEVITIQPTPAEQGQGYYQFKGKVKEDELEAFKYRMKHKKPPD